MNTAVCQLCHHNDWIEIDKIEFGIWTADGSQLHRNNQSYPLGSCRHCKHVQMMNRYDLALFGKLYFHSRQEAVMWHEDLAGNPQPYQQMVDFFQPYLQSGAVVADFGCGTGSLLSAVQQSKFKTSRLIGVDFNDRLSAAGIDYISADLNDLDSMPTKLWSDGLDLAMASHVMEHLIDPVGFLQSLRQHLKSDGQVFIEVPDFTLPIAESLVGISNLVNLQHIHYFSLESMLKVAELAGYTLVAHQQNTTGYIPRLQLLLKNQPPAITPSAKQINHSAVLAVSENLRICRLKRRQLAKSLSSITKKGQQVGLWGVGADCYLLFSENSELENFTRQGLLQLFDHQLAGKVVYGQQILSSDDVANADYPVYLSPLLAETRIKMHKVATNWQTQIIDPFREYFDTTNPL